MREIERERESSKERRTGSVTCSPKRLPKGGQRWDNALKGGVIYG